MNRDDQLPPETGQPSWDRRLHDELRRLPDLTAPAALIPDVMAVIRTREALRLRAWYRRPATTWHPALRVAFGVVSVALLLGLAWGANALWPGVPTWPGAETWTAFAAKLTALREAGRGVINALCLAGESLLTPARLGILAALALSQVLLLGLGSAVWRTAFQPRAD